jgi:flagellar basal body-associated protein FliL
MSISFGSLLLVLAVGFVVYGIYWLSSKRVKEEVSFAEEFRKIWIVADELAKKDGVSGLDSRRDQYLKMMLSLEKYDA